MSGEGSAGAEKTELARKRERPPACESCRCGFTQLMKSIWLAILHGSVQ